MIFAIHRAIARYHKEMISNIGGYVLAKENTPLTSMYFPANHTDIVTCARIREIFPRTATCNVEIYNEDYNGGGKLNKYNEFVNWLLSFVGK